MAFSIPDQLRFGTFVGRFVQAVPDTTADTDRDPDFLPMTGKITFTMNVPSIRVNSDNPVTIVQRPIVATLDADGYIIDSAGARGVRLIATDAQTDPANFGWNISIQLDNAPAKIELLNIPLPGDSSVDLTQVIPVGTGTPTPGNPDGIVASYVARNGTQTRSAISQLILALAPNAGSGGGAVASVNGRTGSVSGLAEQADLVAIANAQQTLAPKASPVFSGTATFTGAVKVPVPLATNDASTKKYVDDTVNGIIASGGVPDATSTVKGRLALTGMLGGTADSPTVPVLLNGSVTQYFRGDRTWQSLNVSAVDGLASVLQSKEPLVSPGTVNQFYRGDKTWQSTLTLPVSTAQQTAIDTAKTELDGGRGPVAMATWTGSISLTDAQIKGSRQVVLSGATTLTLPTMSTTRDAAVTLYLTQGTGGSKTITWPTGVKWDGGVKPTLSTSAGAIDVITLLWNGTYWTGLVGAKAIA